MLSQTPDVQNWGRYIGTLGHPNKLGYFLVLTTLLSLGQFLRLRRNHAVAILRLMWVILIIIQAFGIYLSGSLTAFLGLLLGDFILFVSSKAILLKATTTLALVTGMCILVIMVSVVFNLGSAEAMPSWESNTIAQAVNRVQIYTAKSRLTVFAQAWSQIVRNPWFGVGYDEIYPTSEASALDVHNSLLRIWYAGGLFAFLGWLAMYILLGWMAIKVIGEVKPKSSSALILSLSAATWAILLMDQFQDGIYQREKWLVIGLFATAFWRRQ